MKTSPQVWPLLLVILGIGSFILADHSHSDKVLEGLIAAAAGLVGGGLAMFQATNSKSDESKPAVDPPKPQP